MNTTLPGPWGPESGNVAAQTTLAAPAATGRPMSVATQPGQTAFTRTRWPCSSAASIRASALRAVFDAF